MMNTPIKGSSHNKHRMLSLTRADLTVLGTQNITTLAMLYKQDPLSEDINTKHPVTNKNWPTYLKKTRSKTCKNA